MSIDKLLLQESPILVLPALAKKVGLNEAIVLQQVNYWLHIAEKAGDTHKFVDGRWWTYGTYAEWQENFPWWSVNTIGRIFRGLEKSGYLLSRKPGNQDWDQTKWYTIEYTNLVHSRTPDWNDGGYQNGVILNRNPETSPETSIKPQAAQVPQKVAPPPPSRAQKKGDGVDMLLAYSRPEAKNMLDLSTLPPQYQDYVTVFVHAAGEDYRPRAFEKAKWLKILKEWDAFGITEGKIKAAVEKMRKEGLTIGGPESITKTARGINAVQAYAGDGRQDIF